MPHIETKPGETSSKTKQRSFFETAWDIVVRGFFLLAGLIFILHGIDGVLDGQILPGAGRRGRFATAPSGAPLPLTGWEAVLYGSMFVLLGVVLAGVATGLLQKLSRRFLK
jgi:hypothetical protein